MAFRFSVLASGSAGNASLVQVDGFGLLLDAGLGPRQIAARLTAVEASWRDIHAVLLTHTHGDHWNERTLAQLFRRGIPLYCHDDHHHPLLAYSGSFGRLHTGRLVRTYEAYQELVLSSQLSCTPLPLSHDGGQTFGFRIECKPDLFGPRYRLGYLADLGCWTPELAHALFDVDVLALEFNHDVDLQYASGRSPRLIARVLGDHGHLSNAQAAALLREVVHHSTPGRVKHVVQLHLSRDCNRPELATAAAHAVLTFCQTAVTLHTASQHAPLPTIVLGNARQRRRLPVTVGRPGRRTAQVTNGHPWLPGLEPGV